MSVRSGTSAIRQRQEALAMEPGVQVNAPLKTVEAVVRKHNQKRAVVRVRHRLTHGHIGAAVMFLDDLPIFRMRLTSGISGMVCFAKSPEHVLHAVRRVVQAVEETFAKSLQF